MHVCVCVCVLCTRWCSYLRGPSVASRVAALVWILGVEDRCACICARLPCSSRAAPAIIGRRSSACRHASSHVRCHASRSLALVPSVGIGLVAQSARRRACCVVDCICTRAAVVPWWPLYPGRPPGDLKNTTNTHPKSLERPSMAFEPRGHHFWLGYTFRAGGQSTNEMPPRSLIVNGSKLLLQYFPYLSIPKCCDVSF